MDVNTTNFAHFFFFNQMIFDPNMTKKKKKKKKPFMLDEDGGDGVGEEAKEVETKDAEPEGGDEKDVELDDDDSRKKGWRNDLEALYLYESLTLCCM